MRVYLMESMMYDNQAAAVSPKDRFQPAPPLEWKR